jgi:hypothetical protein
MHKASPTSVQLQSMSEESVFSMLELIDSHFLQRGRHINRSTSTWVFALLAILDDVGSMSNEKVSVLRELGKKAVIVQISFNDAATASQLEDIGYNATSNCGKDGETPTPTPKPQADADSAPEARTKTDSADASELCTTDSVTEKENTLATLDMILTIAGEFFGQRDLLEFRKSWEPQG